MEPFPIDPRSITSTEWLHTAQLVQFLWAIVVINVGIAFLMLLAHAVFPSMVATVEIPRSIRNIRPVFTLLAVIAFAGTLYALLSWLGLMGTIYDIYPKRLI